MSPYVLIFVLMLAAGAPDGGVAIDHGRLFYASAAECENVAEKLRADLGGALIPSTETGAFKRKILSVRTTCIPIDRGIPQ